MSVLSSQFDHSVPLSSPYVEDKVRKVLLDSEGVERVVFVTEDIRSEVEKLGKYPIWSLDMLIKTGSDYTTRIVTNESTRLEGISKVESVGSSFLRQVESSSPDSSDLGSS